MDTSTIVYFWVNGQKYYTLKTITLAELVSYFDYTHALLVLEHNLVVCNQHSWHKILISNFDQIELVTIVGGG